MPTEKLQQPQTKPETRSIQGCHHGLHLLSPLGGSGPGGPAFFLEASHSVSRISASHPPPSVPHFPPTSLAPASQPPFPPFLFCSSQHSPLHLPPHVPLSPSTASAWNPKPAGLAAPRPLKLSMPSMPHSLAHLCGCCVSQNGKWHRLPPRPQSQALEPQLLPSLPVSLSSVTKAC